MCSATSRRRFEFELLGRTDHDHHLALRRHELDRILPVLRRVADVVALRPADLRKARLQRRDDGFRVVHRQRGLGDVGQPLGRVHLQRRHVGQRLHEVHAALGLAHGALGLGVTAVADHHDLGAFLELLGDFHVHLGDQRAGGVEHLEAATLGIRAHRLGDPVRAEHHGSAGRNLGELLDEHRALGAQGLDHGRVVHDLVAHVDRRAELLEGALDDLDGALDAGAKAPGIG